MESRTLNATTTKDCIALPYHRVKELTDHGSESGLKSGSEITYNGAKMAKAMISAALQKHIDNIDPLNCEAGAEEAFYVADLGEVFRQHVRWLKRLPRVTPHYAVKCNPDMSVLRLLAKLGAGFDCASKAEIEQVLSIGVDPSRIIYAQPCKTTSYLRYTVKASVKQMTFDNTDELHKIKAIYPDAELFLRIFTDDSGSLCRLSQKFGATLDGTEDLLSLAHQLGLNVVGIAFHVGSGASDPNAFRQAVLDARTVFDQAAAFGYQLHTLDCGGGFVSETFDVMSAALSSAIEDHFPPHIRVIAEPGRYYTANAFTLACNVIARRTVEDKLLGGETRYMLYINDGVYGNFSSIIFDHQHPVPQVLRTALRPNGYSCSIGGDALLDSGYNSSTEEDAYNPHDGCKSIAYSVWGPTCDGIDCIAAKWESKHLVNVGDWLYFENMGSYTKCSATRFNGFTNKHETIYVSSEPDAAFLLDSEVQ